MSTLLEEYGGQCSATAESFRKLILSVGTRCDEEQLGSILIAILPRNPSFEDKRSETPWNYEIIAEVLQQECKGLNWALVVKCLDNPKLSIRSETDFQVLVQLLVRISGSAIPPAGLIQGLWNNFRAQFAMLALLAGAPRSIVDFSPYVSQDQILPGENIPLPPNFCWLCHPFYARLLEISNNGLAMEVLEILMKAAASYPEYVLSSLAVVQQAGGVRSEVLQRLLPLFTGLAGSRPSSHIMMRRLFATNSDLLFRLCYLAFKKATKAAEIIMTESIVKNMGVQYFRRLESDNTIEDLIGYWCVKSDRQEMNLEERLSASVDAKSVRYLASFAKFHAETLRVRAISQSSDGILSIDSFTVILRALQQFSSVVTADEMKALILFYNQFQQNLQYQGNSFSTGRDAALETTELRSSGPESEEVEAMANAYFQKIYTTDISIQDVIQLLRQFKTSSEKKEQELFRCMVHNLFDEYRFFHKYPEKELQITARLFGSLIQHQLVSSITLGIALRYVLEALRKDPELGDGNDKMFRFGQISLDQFRMRLSEWPQYCSHLIQIPHLSRQNPELFQEAQRALSSPQSTAQVPASNGPSFGPQGYETVVASQPTNYPYLSSAPAASSSGVHLQQSFPSGSTSQFSVPGADGSQQLYYGNTSAKAASSPFNVAATEFTPTSNSSAKDEGAATVGVVKESEKDRMIIVNKAVDEPSLPSDSTRDTVHFIINNIAKNNLETKSQELKDVLKPDLFPWFANYLVEKRVSSQPNLHPLYLTMLDIIDSSELNKLVIDSTLHNVTKFLSSSNITNSTSERSILRHFGMWLGQMTLAKNKPLLQRRINLKQLIFWGYESGHLIAVCPFVAKVVEGVKDSKVFRPPNPWLMAVLGVLKELSEIEDLKLNIKFEVQVLCKNINIKLEDVARSNVLHNCRQPIKDQKNPDFNFKPGQTPSAQSFGASQVQSVQSDSTTGVSADKQSTSLPADRAVDASPTFSVAGGQPGSSAESLNQAINQAVNNVVINPSLSYFASNPTQRRIVAAAVERGIREISQSAVERSVALATTTTKQLILKDFATEGNDGSLQRAAHTMVSSLSGSLSLAICKEPLRISISNHLRSLLAPSISDQTVIEQIVSVCANDNIEIGSSLIEKASIERAIKDIDEALIESYQTRKQSKDLSLPFRDASIATLPSRFPPEIHDLIKQASGLSPSQLQLFENFSRLPAVLAATDPKTAGSISMSQALEAYQVIYTRLDQSLRNVHLQAQGREITLAMLGEQHEVTQLIKDLVTVTQRTMAGMRNETAMTFSESIFNKLFDTTNPSPLRLEVFVTILEAVKEACGGPKNFNPDIFAWLGKYSSSIADEFSRRLYRHILLLLIRSKLIKPQEIDSYLVVHMDGGADIFWLELALTFIKQSVGEALCSVYDFTTCIEAIQQMRPANVNVRKTLQKWILDMKSLATTMEERRASPGGNHVPIPAPASAKDATLKQQIAALLEKWLAVWSSINDQLFSQYLQLLHQFGVFRSEESADKFFKLSLEVCVEASVKSTSQDSTNVMNYMFMDGLSKLFTLLIRVADKEASSDPLAPRASLNLLNRMLSVVARSIFEDHEAKKLAKTAFDQRPYHRILSNMSQDLGVPSEDRPDVATSLLPLAAAHAQCYMQIQPSVVPGFAYSWLLLISKRTFMPYLVRNQKGWQTMHKIISSLLLFLQPFLKVGVIHDAIKKLYRGTLRILLVLLHDFPEFLCDFHLSMCDIIPLNCVQLRNLILSAFPRTMRLPDPFTPNLRLDNLPEALLAPRVLVDFQGSLGNIRAGVDNYLSSQQPADFATSLSTIISAVGPTNSSIISALIFYIGSQSLSQPAKASGNELIKSLVYTCDSEIRYIMLNSIANQLRYPNSHTSYFSSILLAIFSDTENEIVQEQVTRVLLERLIAHRPHPVILSSVFFLFRLHLTRNVFTSFSFDSGVC